MPSFKENRWNFSLTPVTKVCTITYLNADVRGAAMKTNVVTPNETPVQ